MTSKLEEIARAIKSATPKGYGMTGPESLQYARVAVKAMREPNEAMLEEGGGVIPLEEENYHPDKAAQSAREVWSEMISAILNEKP